MKRLEDLSCGNAAGMVKTIKDVAKACDSAATEITVGSFTAKMQEGNIPDSGHGRVYYYHEKERWSLNALGMPNMGMEKLKEALPEMVRLAHAAGKKLRVSIAGFTPDEYADMAVLCYGLDADEVEANFGCPNIWGEGGVQKTIPSYDPIYARTVLHRMREKLGGRKIAVKISPVDSLSILQPLLYFIKDSTVVSSIIACNTIPNQERVGEDGYPALSFNVGNHKGGLAGEELRIQSLQLCKFVRAALPHTIEVCGVGGIFGGRSAKNYIDQEVSGFQIGTAYYQQGPKSISDVLFELAELVE